MRVTHIITRLIVGGAQENTIATVLGLRRLPGMEVDLISGPTAGPEGSLESRVSQVPGLLTVVPSLVRPVHPWHDVQAWRRLTQLLRERRPDIVHTHSGKAGVIGRLAARRARVPVIVHTIHGPSFGPFQGWLANLAFTSAERLAGRLTDHFVVVAEAMARQYLAAGIGAPDRYTRIFSGFDLRPFLNAANDPDLRRLLGLRPDDFVVGKIARLFQLKGHDDLFAVAPELIRRCPRIQFLLVGDGRWRDRFESLARAPGLAGHFVFTGLVAPEEVPRYVGIMDALVHLSLREGLARALPQALAAGKPVVAYDADGAAEVCFNGETGFLVAPGDREALLRAIAGLAEAPDEGRRLGLRGRAFVERHFAVEDMVAAIARLYRDLLDRRSGADRTGP
ncbi:MAG: glycosyltransferase family 4 protein [Verrucomicrobia bacterium]|jgi:glycosyltransferase involved in cell wall biosynthesis|nr:glycosyltransferase family 4 protein [Verrucomicrobiota bacterium]